MRQRFLALGAALVLLGAFLLPPRVGHSGILSLLGVGVKPVSSFTATAIAAGGDGKVSTSTDLTTWTSHTVDGSTTLTGVAYGASIYVVVGSGGKIFSSPDFTTWTDRSVNTDYNLKGVIFAASLFVAVGQDAGSGTEIILSSSDGTSWTSRSNGQDTAQNAVIYNGTKWITIGVNGVLFSSTNGTSWSNFIFNVTSTTGYALAYDGVGTLVAAADSGAVYQSTNGGTVWTPQTSGFGGSNILSATYDGSKFGIFGDSGKRSTSPDGATWTAQAAVGSNDIRSAAFIMSKVVVGNTATASNIRTSATVDGTFTAASSGTAASILAISVSTP